MTQAEEGRLQMSANGWRRPIGPDDPQARARLEAAAAVEYDRCHPDDSFAALMRRARFAKEDQGLLQDWLAAAGRQARRPPGPVAVIAGADGETIQALLAAAAAECRAGGLAVAGVVAARHGLDDRTCTAGFLRDVASDASWPIYLEQSPAGTACHLDADGVEAACAALLGRVAQSDLVVLSKFGKLEAAGGGLFPVFASARASGRPILTAVSERHRAAFEAFAPDAVPLAAEASTVAAWCRAAGGAL
jgi:hypothetical protein